MAPIHATLADHGQQAASVRGQRLSDVCTIDGIKVRFYLQIRDHPPAHFHAIYGSDASVIQIDPPEVVKSGLRRPQESTALEFAKTHKDELLQAWNEARAGKIPTKIRLA